jgi:hypothetical protein
MEQEEIEDLIECLTKPLWMEINKLFELINELKYELEILKEQMRELLPPLN